MHSYLDMIEDTFFSKKLFSDQLCCLLFTEINKASLSMTLIYINIEVNTSIIFTEDVAWTIGRTLTLLVLKPHIPAYATSHAEARHVMPTLAGFIV